MAGIRYTVENVCKFWRDCPNVHQESENSKLEKTVIDYLANVKVELENL